MTTALLVVAFVFADDADYSSFVRWCIFCAWLST